MSIVPTLCVPTLRGCLLTWPGQGAADHLAVCQLGTAPTHSVHGACLQAYQQGGNPHGGIVVCFRQVGCCSCYWHALQGGGWGGGLQRGHACMAIDAASCPPIRKRCVAVCRLATPLCRAAAPCRPCCCARSESRWTSTACRWVGWMGWVWHRGCDMVGCGYRGCAGAEDRAYSWHADGQVHIVQLNRRQGAADVCGVL